MKIKRVYLLLIFIFSILMTNLHYSDLKPPLVDKSTTNNILILADNVESVHENLIAVDLPDYDHSFITSDNYKDFIPIFVTVALVMVQLLKEEIKIPKISVTRGLYGIIFWDKKRILRN